MVTFCFGMLTWTARDETGVRWESRGRAAVLREAEGVVKRRPYGLRLVDARRERRPDPDGPIPLQP